MAHKVSRRKFVGLAAAAALTPSLARLAGASRPKKKAGTEGTIVAPVKMQPFNYENVRLLDGPSQRQVAAARDFYFGIPDDDILKGFRRKADLPAPGQDMGGWCGDTTAIVFGQWLSGMARLSHATGDAALRDKALTLMTEWGKTLPKLSFGHYDYDKYVCGLVDLAEFAGSGEALTLLASLTDRAEHSLGRIRLPATDADSQGGFFNGEMEWYTLAENLCRAYLLTGDVRYREFADVWRYPHYWEMFTDEALAKPDGFHGYSHVNTLSSAAMLYAVTGEAHYLTTITNAYDYFQRTQCYATGGYGPGEKLMPADGSLGRSIEVEPNAKYLSGSVGRSFETPCGTWAVFKLCRYLLQYTGEARYGDWMERLLYNGIGAALPMHGRGQTFYYADYRLRDARKYCFGDPWPCCSGTYLQNIAEYYNLIYFHDSDGLCVNLYLPSEVTWDHGGQQITLTQRTSYPKTEMVLFALHMARPAAFALRVRVPAWAEGVMATVNDQPVLGMDTPGAWATMHREWHPGDRITLRIPLHPRQAAIDEQHPQRVALVRGPVVLVRPHDSPVPSGGAQTPAGMTPFPEIGRDRPYSMYSDLET